MDSATRRRFMLALALAMSLAPVQALGQSGSWDRAANIKSAATEITEIRTRKGANGAFAAIGACYEESVTPAQTYSQAVEACLTQDVLISRLSASVYASVSPEARKMSGSPEPEAVMGEMAARVEQTFRRFDVPPDAAREIVRDMIALGDSAMLEAMQ
ncbi:MAG: hypothetical protein O3A96_13455 [Proteobacteria bacterium]|nr:hypothetical protein [Pseudomonadota bacterium]